MVRLCEGDACIIPGTVCFCKRMFALTARGGPIPWDGAGRGVAEPGISRACFCEEFAVLPSERALREKLAAVSVWLLDGKSAAYVVADGARSALN